MIKCLVIDDDTVFLALMEHFVNQHPSLSLVGRCDSAAEAIKILSNQTVDLILLDIEMPGVNGLELVKSSNLVPQVIFVTAHTEYAVEAFEYDVTDYIVKPINQGRFDKAIDKAMSIAKYQELSANREHLYFKVNSKLVKILANNIIAVEAFGDYIKLYEGENRHVILGTLNNMQNTLNTSKFMRVHRRFIVKLEAIKNLQGHEVEMENGRKIQVSRNMKAELVARLNITV